MIVSKFYDQMIYNTVDTSKSVFCLMCYYSSCRHNFWKLMKYDLEY